MTELIRLEEYGKEKSYHLYYYNGVFCGDFLMGDDGYYEWWPEFPSRGGSLSSHFLREVADKLDKLNADWNKIVQEECK